MRPAETSGRRTGRQVPTGGSGVALRPRLEGSGEDVGRSLGRLVVTLLEVVRQVVERQALRRADAGDLTEQQVEKLGRALIDLEDTFDELRDTFGVREEDLYLPLDVRRLLDSETARPPGSPMCRCDSGTIATEGETT